MKLVAQGGPLSGQEWPMGSDKPVIVLGRGDSSDIVLQDQQASRHHAEIRFSEGQVSITDAGGMNGTFVNDDRVCTHSHYPWDPCSDKTYHTRRSIC